ncbi:hypothetical protein GGS23DRAFT_548714 [Durotheca rogersii]|uniref:uncharacterized protein n=1 Tax=Durotheca rogersii TaxID=419775 RepID=UPI00221EB744|nr:uncharacterized protein GGS23DRAFT_548714 [Durotheca rogersii]KAI5867511.1 hypothetical protein GGS23DRAFT_548714 [Durotheca rogersii]
MSFRALPVYHRTDIFHRGARQDQRDVIRRGRLYGSVNRNQVAPTVGVYDEKMSARLI